MLKGLQFQFKEDTTMRTAYVTKTMTNLFRGVILIYMYDRNWLIFHDAATLLLISLSSV